MAELAAGAVSSLLGVIRNEAQLLGRVGHDVQFIREEMESMQSFLTHLSRKEPTDGEHDEQIRTWMNQVRLLAQDSNNCIDMYLYRGNPELHLARGGLRRYVAWLPWFLHKMVAQHRAAIQLRVLRERARDIGERRLRYGVEVPTKGAGAEQSPTGAGLMPVATSSSLAHLTPSSAASGDEEEDNDNQLMMGMAATKHSAPIGAIYQPRTPEDNVRVKLAEWIKYVAQGNTSKEKSIASVAIVAPDKEETLALAMEASAIWDKHATGRRCVLVDIPGVHFFRDWLQSRDILYYILRVLRQQGQGRGEEEQDLDKRKIAIGSEKRRLFDEITKNIKRMKLDNKISEIKGTITQMKGGQRQLNLEEMNGDQLDLLKSSKDEPLGVLLRAMLLLKQKPDDGSSATKPLNQETKEATLLERKEAKPLSHEDIIKETAKNLKNHMEQNADENQKPKDLTEESRTGPIHLERAHYEHILRVVFPVKPLQIREQDSNQATITRTTILADDPFKEVIRKVLMELQGDTSMKKLDKAEIHKDKSKQPDTPEVKEYNQSIKKQDATVSKSNLDCIPVPDALIEETTKKIGQIEWRLKEQLKIKGIIDKINDCLKIPDSPILVILKLDNDFISGWEDTKNAFNMFGRIAGALMLKTTEYATRAKEYCFPPREPIDYSLLGLYRDTTLELTKKQITKDSAKILLDILDKCKSHELCMKIFVHALYANPKRSNEELRKLHGTLQQVSDNSLDNIAKKMLKFSYGDLPKEYKSCLMYLAIFPRQQAIKRSTLIGRWVVEGLIAKEDWASSVRHANRCFDALVNRWLVYPADIGATGHAKSCVIGDLVHGFITKIARKQRIVETRLSHHLARHFSIFNDLRLRGSDRIDRFFQKLYEESSRVSLIKVLDLDGCQCFGGKNKSYLKDICNTMLLLKYLSLRGTNVTHLPSEINNLRELEVLDIRETKVHPSATVNVLLLKLKRLLAGRVVQSLGSSSTALSSVEVPDKVEKMLSMEVLSNVKARNRQDLKDIGKLWQLRKLGVVTEHKDSHFRNLLRAISDLHECLKSLSITLPMVDEDPSNQEFTEWVLERYKDSPKLLESLSIVGTPQTVQLLRLLTKDSGQLHLAKVTLSGTHLTQDDLEVLAKLPKLICVRLRHKAYIDRKLTFKNEEFKNLKCFLVEDSNITDINFEGGAPKLEKIILSSIDSLQYIYGVEGLLELKEVELKNNTKLSLFDKARNISKVTLCRTILSQDEVQILAKISSMRTLVLKETSYVQNQLIFYKDDFPRLNLLIVDFSAIPNISFTGGSATRLEKIIWSFTMGTISGIDNLPKLKEFEFNGDFVPNQVKEAINKHKNIPKLIHNKPENQYKEAGNIQEKRDVTRFPFCWKIQD
ncbi:unnamed protein product [Triticum turgidum subsp. durum]|uniref:Rx N-terminal domain-containing protein n=1 Tax=Triticum turgidum subsp. durum TaxID=4567 RepID=A0A9R0SNT0_TRITD|nr:unnamed protein product [Triticum turgidum subsp. durum]